MCCAVYAVHAVAAPPAESRVTIDNFTFKPDVITVPIGTRIVWENDDDIPHYDRRDPRASSTPPPSIPRTSTASPSTRAGTFEYFCGLHPHMKGKVVVTQ